MSSNVNNSIRLLEERAVGNEILLMKWCNKMDLLAMTNTKGEVFLHRLSWQRVWCIPAKTDGSHVADMAWRPDGKIIAIAYSSGEVILVEVETKNILHKIVIEDEITCIAWQQEKRKTKSPEYYDNEDAIFMGDAGFYLPDLPPLSPEYAHTSCIQIENAVHLNFGRSYDELNILVIGTKSGLVQISVFGLFTCAYISVSQSLEKPFRVLNVYMSETLNTLYVTLLDNENNICVSAIDTSVIHTHSDELYALAFKHGQLVSMIIYMNNTMAAINEAWEAILLEMDSKLYKYSSSVSEGTVTADFLQLLLFGVPSDEMEEFLMQDLTDKGLKKLGQSIELSYSNIQKLLHRHLTRVSESVSYYLAELRGMAKLKSRYNKLGLNEDTIAVALRENGAFMVKVFEVQQVINQCMTSYKAFFRWLYVVILRMMDEQIPAEIQKMAQQDISYIVEFVQNFDNIGSATSGKKSRFYLEKLGQYLWDSPLTLVPDIERSLWDSFLLENECIANDEFIIKQYKMKSLVQQHNSLVGAIENIFFEPKELISDNFEVITSFLCLRISNIQNFSLTYLNFDETVTYMALLDTEIQLDGLYVLHLENTTDVTVCCCYLYSSFVPDETENSLGPCKLIDVKFYSTTYLSVILRDVNNDSYICQVPIEHLNYYMAEIDLECDTIVLNPEISKVDIYELEGIIIKKIEGISVSKFDVTGGRHVAAVLSNNRRKVQLYEMEAGDEEEDEEEGDDTYVTANNTHDGSELQEEEDSNSND